MGVLLYEEKEHIASITLNRPARLNTLNRELADALVDAVQDYDRDPNLWAAIITGTGEKSFSAGRWPSGPARNLQNAGAL
jgi:enoyl-CoA hydratase/carnithine racemase